MKNCFRNLIVHSLSEIQDISKRITVELVEASTAIRLLVEAQLFRFESYFIAFSAVKDRVLSIE